jgi:hypothetical protein
VVRTIDPDLPADPQTRIHQLWDELADFSVADIDAALSHLLNVVARLLQADNAYWLGVVRMLDDNTDPIRGWRPRATRHLHTTALDKAFASRAMKDLTHGIMD